MDNPYKAPRAEMKKIIEGVFAYLQPFVFYSSNADLDATCYIPGHGPVVDKEYVVDARDFLIKLLEETRKCFDKGLSLQEAAKTIDLDKKRWPSFPFFFRIAQCARAYSEFRGEEPGRLLDINLAELITPR